MQVTGLLLKNGIQARLIQSNDSFSLYNLAEIRFFVERLNFADDVSIATDHVWEQAKRELKDKFRNSTKLQICNNLISDFESINPKKKYKSDLEVFIQESRLEDFINDDGNTIFVSTIHKAKGKEFDNVFLMLEDFDPSNDEAKRQLYVAMTRAKQNLTIHLNSDFLDHIKAENLERKEDVSIYPALNETIVHLNHSDVWLSYFSERQALISGLTSGDTLTVNPDGSLSAFGQPVVKFSRNFEKEVNIKLKEKGFELKHAKVNFIVYWKNKEEEETKIILPKLCYERTSPE